jgi:hypothetical protein
MSDTPKKETGKPAKPTKPETELSDKDLDKAAGGAGLPHTINRQSDEITGIKGPSWVNLMTYRKAGAASEPSAQKSVSELFEKLAAEDPD